MQAEMLVIAQRIDHGIGYSTYTNLQGGSVRYLVSDEITNTCFYLAWHRGWHFNEWFITTAHSCYLTYMYHRVTKRARHVFIDLCNDGLRTFGTRESDIGRDAIGAIAVLVGFADIEKCHIHRHLSATEQKWHFAQEAWDGVRYTLSHSAAQVVGNKNIQRTERVHQFALGIWCFFGMNAEARDNFHIAQFVGTLGERTQKYHRYGGGTLYDNRVARFHETHSLRWR